MKIENIIDALPVGASLMDASSGKRQYANKEIMRFFSGTSLGSLDDIMGLKTDDYHKYNPLHPASEERYLARLERELVRNGTEGMSLYDRVAVLPDDAGIVICDAHLRPFDHMGKRIAVLWLSQDSTRHYTLDRILEFYLDAYRRQGREKDGVAAFIRVFKLASLLPEAHRTKQYLRILLTKVYKDRAYRVRERMYRAPATIVTYGTHINQDLSDAGITVRDVRHHMENILQSKRGTKEQLPAQLPLI